MIKPNCNYNPLNLFKCSLNNVWIFGHVFVLTQYLYSSIFIYFHTILVVDISTKVPVFWTLAQATFT